MPSAVYVQGRVTRRPGAYGEGDASRLSGRVVNLNRVALIGDFPELEQAVPRELSGARRISEINKASDKLANIALWLYNSFNDDRIRGGPSAVVMVSARQTTQAVGLFLDDAAEASLELKAAVWGPAGNRTRVKIDENAGDASLRDFTFNRDGQTEEFLGLGSGDLLTVAYDGAGAATNVGLEAAIGSLKITNSKNDVAVPSVFSPTTMAFSGKLTLTPDVAPGLAASGKKVNVTVHGINKSTGLPAPPELHEWLEDDGAPWVSDTEWSSIDSIAITETGGADTTSLTVAADAFIWDTDDLDSLAQAADIINAQAGAGYSATADPVAENVTLDDIDEHIGTIWNGVAETPQSVRADLWAIIEALNSSLLVIPARMTNGDSPPAATSGEVLLVGGAKLATQDYSAAFDSLRSQDAQILWMESTDVADIKTGRAHCQYMAGIGRGERNLWAGSDPQKTLEQLKSDYTTQINSRHVSLCVQEPQLTNARGKDVWVNPEYLALLMAGGQSGTNVGVPITKKYPNVLDVRQHPSWDPDEEADLALARGLCVINKQRLGWQVERSITTYLTDDNPVYSEVSTNESFNQSIRILREQMEAIVGDPGVPTTPGRIRSIAISSLDQQIRDQIIRAYNNRAVTIDDLGDAYRVNYEFRPIEPINFVIVAASAVRKFSDQ
jgi:hypothetical protein